MHAKELAAQFVVGGLDGDGKGFFFAGVDAGDVGDAGFGAVRALAVYAAPDGDVFDAGVFDL